jgi:hypothetical protein
VSTLIIVLIAIVVIAAILIAVTAASKSRQRAALRQQYGSEYDRTVENNDGQRGAVKDLKARNERREQLDIQPLAPAAAERYRNEWRMLQERFVDAPAESVAMAHTLLTSAMSDRGYPTSEQDDRMSLLSVDHADVVDRYRKGATTEQRWRDSGSADTEDLRQAMQHYRAVFDRVVSPAGSNGSGTTGSGDDAYPTESTDQTNRTGTTPSDARSESVTSDASRDRF